MMDTRSYMQYLKDEQARFEQAIIELDAKREYERKKNKFKEDLKNAMIEAHKNRKQ